MKVWEMGSVPCAMLMACSSSASSSSSPPATSKLLAQLSPPEQTALCESLAQMAGGYGQHASCNGDAGITNITFWSDQSQCTAGLALVPPTCHATVSQYTPCVQWALSCSSVDMPYPENCQILAGPACKPTELGVGYSTAPTIGNVDANADN